MTTSATPSSLCGSPVGPACFTCRREGCPAMRAAMVAAMRTTDPNRIEGRNGAMFVALLGGTLPPSDPDETPRRRLRLV